MRIIIESSLLVYLLIMRAFLLLVGRKPVYINLYRKSCLGQGLLISGHQGPESGRVAARTCLPLFECLPCPWVPSCDGDMATYKQQQGQILPTLNPEGRGLSLQGPRLKSQEGFRSPGPEAKATRATLPEPCQMGAERFPRGNGVYCDPKK